MEVIEKILAAIVCIVLLKTFMKHVVKGVWPLTGFLVNVFRNPGYPSSYSTATSCTWSFPKIHSDVCMIR